MAVGVFGVPSVYTTLCVHLIKGLLACSFGSSQTIKVSALKDIETSTDDISAQDKIIFANTPEPDLIEFLIRQKAPLVGFLSSFNANVRELIEWQGVQPLKAIRDTSLSLAALEEVIFAPDVFIIRSENQRTIEIQQVLRRVADFLGLRLERSDFAWIIGNLALRTAADGNVYLEDQLNQSLLLAGCGASKKGSGDWQLVSSIAGYDSILRLNPASKVYWPAGIFLTREKVSSAAESISLMGPSRFLVFGPYLGLPRGKWIATAFFSTADNTSRNRVELDIAQNCGQAALAICEFELPISGSYGCEMTFINDNPHFPIEVRLGTKEGAIEGELRFLGVEFERK